MSRNKDEAISDFFRNKEGKIQYNNKCLHCINNCKQSYKVEIICCPRYQDRQAKTKNKDT